jgi:hypothetical protein
MLNGQTPKQPTQARHPCSSGRPGARLRPLRPRLFAGPAAASMIDLIFSFIHCLTTSSIGDDLPPLHVDGALIYEGGRLLQDGGAKSPTCNAIGLKDT